MIHPVDIVYFVIENFNPMKKTALLILTVLCSVNSYADKLSGNDRSAIDDTTKVVDIEEVVVIATPKETGKLRTLPSSVSLVSQKDIQINHITSLKRVSALVPNFFMPDYGSRLTSAVYIRGIGSRINTPAVGMYVDNIPYIDKSAFDFNFYDIERIDILRGPQGTLYGRNTMGGLVKVHTKSPFSYQGTDLKIGYATKDNHRSIALTHYHRISNRFAFSAGGYYEGSDGFFRHAFTGKKVDDVQAGGGRIRAVWFPAENWKLDFTTGYDYSDEGGYPYYYTGTLNGKELHQDWIGKITNNRESKYRRGLFNTGLQVEFQAKNFIMNTVTGYQHLHDRMAMDQDYLPLDIYILEQKQRQSTLSEEITFKSKGERHWEWVTGISSLYQWLHTDGPVTFHEDGISSLIENNVNSIFASIRDTNPHAPEMSLDVTSKSLFMRNTFDTPILSTAFFHQSSLKNLLFEGLSFTLGARLEYEKMKMDYFSDGNIDFDFRIVMKPSLDMTIPHLNAHPLFNGKLQNEYWQLLPKFALKYDFNKINHLYASVTKGYRSGGYNVQMFSDIVQGDMASKMIDAIFDDPKLAPMKDRFLPILKEKVPGYGVGHDIKATTTYKPEYSWNYELGSHLDLISHKLRMDMAVFYMDTRDQQIARFAENGWGRMMVNAGKSESYGAELSLKAAINQHVNLSASYGYTHATFKDYEGGTNSVGIKIDYRGNYIPFVPRHTLNVGGDYSFLFKNHFAQSLTLGVNYIGAGKIYWTEKNDVSENFDGTLNAYIFLQCHKALSINMWGRNLTAHRYTTFYFESINRGYKQLNKPFQLGIDIRYQF